MVIGRVITATVDESHNSIDAVTKNFTFYIHAPKDFISGEGETEAHAILKTYER